MRTAFVSFIVALSITYSATGQIESKSIRPLAVGRKVALVIGNSHYRTIASVPPASNDADDMATTLRTLGFDSITVKKDLTADELIGEVGKFTRTNVQAGDLALVYYSGHGGQIGEDNFLLPVDYDPPSDEDLVDRRAYRMSKLRDALERTGARVRVLIFDACRNSPVVTSKSGIPGLRALEGKAEGTIIAFASAHNQVARYNSNARNSFYTSELLTMLKQPREDFKTLLEEVQHKVYENTEHQQTPYLYGFLSAPLYLGSVPTLPPPTSTITPPTVDLDAERFMAVKESRDPDQLESVANKMKRADLADILRERARALRSQTAGATSAAKVDAPAISSNLQKQADTAYDRGDYGQAAQLYQRLADASDPWGTFRLGYFYERGLGVSKDTNKAVTLYRKAADAGNGPAMNNLALLYVSDRAGLPRDPQRAYDLLQKAINVGNNDAMVNMGWMYETGQGIPANAAKAAEWYRKGAEAGNAIGMKNLGIMYLNGTGVPKDDRQAVVWLQKGADAGNAEAMLNLGYMHEAGRGGLTKDPIKAVEWYRKGAEAGNAQSMKYLADMYADGRGVPKNDFEASKWYQKSADNGNAAGMNSLGIMLQNGRGVRKDVYEAAKWYRKAAEAGNTDGMVNLGYLMENGLGITRDDSQAFEWYRRAADAGNSIAMKNIGVMYSNGKGVAKDESQALLWYRKSADAGNTDGMASVGWMYATGRAVPRDDREAVRWYRKAAEGGSAFGMNNLGAMYEGGLGVNRDLNQAISWYRKSAEGGFEKASENLKRLGQ